MGPNIVLRLVHKFVHSLRPVEKANRGSNNTLWHVRVATRAPGACAFGTHCLATIVEGFSDVAVAWVGRMRYP